ncbi:MAG: hypothetical protein U0165_18605 [Polyangiaceae bacterium]
MATRASLDVIGARSCQESTLAVTYMVPEPRSSAPSVMSFDGVFDRSVSP